MKTLNNLNDALAYLLEGMYHAEKKLQIFLPLCIDQTDSHTLKNEVKKYLVSTSDKRTKLKRVFSYLLTGHFGRKNKVIEGFLKDKEKLQNYVMSSELKDAMLIADMQAIVHYKISTYGTAKAFAATLELQKVVDLLAEVLEWEKEADIAFTKVAMKEVNEKAAVLLTA